MARGARVRISRANFLTVCASALALVTACRDVAPTDPVGRPAVPATPELLLTGGVGTPIFPVVLSGESQAVGYAIGLNNAGQVTGAEFGLDLSDDSNKPYRWTAEAGAVKIVACCDVEYGVDINDAGVVVGTVETSRSTGTRAFVAPANTGTQLPILPGASTEGDARAFAINNGGQIVGVSIASDGNSHAVLWSAAGIIQDLGTLGGARSSAIDINTAGQVIGSSLIAGDATTHFFLWSSGGGMVDLNTTLGAPITDVVEINDAGQIVGTFTSTGGATHAFLYTPGSGLRDLGTLGGGVSTPTGLNGAGDVVGSSTLADGSMHAFLWTDADGMEDITARTGVPEVRRLNDALQTLTGTASPTSVEPRAISHVTARLVQLHVTRDNTPPQALFSVTCTGLACILDARESLDDEPGLTYAWDLNKYPDGTATGAVVAVTYPHESQRTITLTVTDAGGLSSTLSKTITVTPRPPNAAPVARFTAACDGLACTLDASSSTDDEGIVSYDWNLDKYPDGTASGKVVVANYPHAGARNVTLTVIDGKGLSSSVTQTIELP